MPDFSVLSPLLDLVAPAAYAQQAGAPGQPSILSAIWPLFILAPLFYFMMIRPQMKRSREARDMMAKLAKGDEIVISGGLAGKVTSIGENYATVEIADKVEVKVQKSAIGTVLPKGTLKNL